MNKIKNSMVIKLLSVGLVFCCFVLSCILLNSGKTAYAVNDAVITLQNSADNVTLLGGGAYAINDKVTIKAPLKASNDKLFVKWQDGVTDVSTSATYSFIATKSVTLTAIYESKSYSLNVNTVRPADDAVSATSCTPIYNADGLQLSFNVTATDANSVFDGWYYNAKRLSESPTNFVMNFGDVYSPSIKVNAKFRKKDSTLILFIRDGDIVIKSDYVTTASTIAPDAYKSGHEFSKWVRKSDNVEFAKNATIPVISGTSQVYEAVFTPIVAPCVVTVIGGTANTPNCNKFDRVTLSATDATNFGYWTIDNQIVSYGATYTFTVDGDVTVKANNKEANFVARPSVYLSKNSKLIARGTGFALSPIAYITSASGYEIVEKGLLLAENVDENLNLISPNIKKITSSTKTNGQLTGTFINLNDSTKYTTRAYIVYKNGANLYVDYSNVVIFEPPKFNVIENFENDSVIDNFGSGSGVFEMSTAIKNSGEKALKFTQTTSATWAGLYIRDFKAKMPHWEQFDSATIMVYNDGNNAHALTILGGESLTIPSKVWTKYKFYPSKVTQTALDFTIINYLNENAQSDTNLAFYFDDLEYSFDDKEAKVGANMDIVATWLSKFSQLDIINVNVTHETIGEINVVNNSFTISDEGVYTVLFDIKKAGFSYATFVCKVTATDNSKLIYDFTNGIPYSDGKPVFWSEEGKITANATFGHKNIGCLSFESSLNTWLTFYMGNLKANIAGWENYDYLSFWVYIDAKNSHTVKITWAGLFIATVAPNTWQEFKLTKAQIQAYTDPHLLFAVENEGATNEAIKLYVDDFVLRNNKQ